MDLNGCNFITPWCWWDNAFTNTQLTAISQLVIPSELEAASVGNGICDDHIRTSLTQFIYNTTANTWIFDILDEVVSSLNNQYFKFNVYRLDSFQYTRYVGANNGHYSPHWDMLEGNLPQPQRKISVVLQLTDPSEYTGGDLILYPGGCKTVMQKKKGYICVFPSFVTHEVLPVTNGTRDTLVAWYTGPNWA